MAQPGGTGRGKRDSGQAAAAAGSGHHHPHQSQPNAAQQESFYSTLSQRIAENLLFYVDGIGVGKSPLPMVHDPCPRLGQMSAVNEQPSSPAVASAWPGQGSALPAGRASSSQHRPRRSVAGSNVDTKKCYLLCAICGQATQTMQQFADHHENNHRHVAPGYCQVEPNTYSPSQLFAQQHHDSQGLLRTSTLIPASALIKCTKCNASFESRKDLHQHIFECASAGGKQKSSTPSAAGKSLVVRRDKSDDIDKGQPEAGATNKPDQEEDPRATKREDLQAGTSVQSSKSLKRKGKPVDSVPKRVNLDRMHKSAAIVNSMSERSTANRARTISNSSGVKTKEQKPPEADTSPKSESDAPASSAVINKRQQRFSCSKCNQSFRFRSSLNKHRRMCVRATFKSKAAIGKKVASKRVMGKRLVLRSRRSTEHAEDTDSKPVDDDDDVDGMGAVKQEERKPDLEEENTIKKKLRSSSEADPGRATPEPSSSKTGERAKEHTCEKCSRTFRNIANYHRHIKVCKGTPPPEKPAAVKAEPEPEKKEEAPTTSRRSARTPKPKEPGFELYHDRKVPSRFEQKLDLFKVKQDHPTYAFKGSPAQFHSCEYCHRSFTYLANYRKHLKMVCPMRGQLSNGKAATNGEPASPPSRSETASPSEPEANGIASITQSDECTKAPEAGAENGNGHANGSKGSFSCNICHRSFQLQFQMMRHRLSHKLNESSAAEEGDDDEEEKTAKKALAKHQPSTRSTRRSVRIAQESSADNDAPSLLEDLARGGQQIGADALQDSQSGNIVVLDQSELVACDDDPKDELKPEADADSNSNGEDEANTENVSLPPNDGPSDP